MIAAAHMFEKVKLIGQLNGKTLPRSSWFATHIVLPSPLQPHTKQHTICMLLSPPKKIFLGTCRQLIRLGCADENTSSRRTLQQSMLQALNDLTHCERRKLLISTSCSLNVSASRQRSSSFDGSSCLQKKKANATTRPCRPWARQLVPTRCESITIRMLATSTTPASHSSLKASRSSPVRRTIRS
jgi:hypothetical protein